MSKIKNAFANGKAFVAFVTCGDPDLETTEAIVKSMADNGADLIELGIPFSDPTAEGPVIQGASLRALNSGTTADKIFETVRNIRAYTDIPMVFMTYANVIFSYVAERFMERASALGIDGLILPDIPFEEKEEFDAICDKYGMDLISMIAPTSGQRISMIAKQAKGFIYLVSSLGVTGMRSKITTDIPSMVRIIRESTDVPVAVGFGISTPEQARAMYEASDGAIVGSAIVKIVEKYGRDAAGPVGEYVKSMKAAAKGM